MQPLRVHGFLLGAVSLLGVGLSSQSQFRNGATLAAAQFGQTGFVAGDLDGDLDMDLLIRRDDFTNRGRLGVLRNDGRGNFTEVPGAILNYDWTLSELELVDTDRDGDLDVVAGVILRPSIGGVVLLFENDGRGVFTDISSTNLPRVFAGANEIEVIDAEGDGDPDLLVINIYDRSNLLLLNNGRGQFTDATAGRIPTTLLGSRDAVAGDIDGDGDPDAILFRRQRKVFYHNNGFGRFAETVGVMLPPGSRDPRLVDLDGDGDPDLLYQSDDSPAGETLQVEFNDGRGSFTPMPTSGLPRQSTSFVSFATGDFDDDGDLDVWIGRGDSLCVSGTCSTSIDQLYLNDGSGNFAPAPSRITGIAGATYATTAVDVDLDGDLDLIQVVRPTRRPLTEVYTPRIWINLHRQLSAPRTVPRGGTYTLEFHHRPGYAVIPGAALPFLSLREGRFRLPGLGIVALDPGALVALPAVSIPFAGRGTQSLSVPNDPSLQNVQFFGQALIGPAPTYALANLVATKIL